MEIIINIKMAAVIVILFALIQFCGSVYIKTKIEASVKEGYSKILEEYKFELKAREQTTKVAEYLALYIANSDNFLRMNQLSFELALWLPEDTYKKLGKAVKKTEGGKNIYEVLVEIKEGLLQKKTELTDEDIIWHAEGVGSKRTDTTIK